MSPALRLFLFIVVALGIATSASAIAVLNPLCPGSSCTFDTIFDRITDYALLVLAPIAIIIILYVGFIYMTSGGNAERVKQAHGALLWAIVGIAIVLLAKGLYLAIKSVLGP